MKKTKINQVFAFLALFAITFSVISTGVMIFLSPSVEAPTKEDVNLNELIKNFSWSTKITSSGNTFTWTTTWTTK